MTAFCKNDLEYIGHNYRTGGIKIKKPQQLYDNRNEKFSLRTQPNYYHR